MAAEKILLALLSPKVHQPLDVRSQIMVKYNTDVTRLPSGQTVIRLSPNDPNFDILCVDRNIRNFNQTLVSAGASDKRELLILDPRSEILKEKYKILKVRVLKDKKPYFILKEVEAFVRGCFTSENIQKILDTSPKLIADKKIILLNNFLNKSVGVCRHRALFNCYLLSRLQEDGILNGEIIHYRTNLPGGGAHTWALFKSNGNGKLYSLDSMWGEFVCITDTPLIFFHLYGYKVYADTITAYSMPLFQAKFQDLGDDFKKEQFIQFLAKSPGLIQLEVFRQQRSYGIEHIEALLSVLKKQPRGGRGEKIIQREEKKGGVVDANQRNNSVVPTVPVHTGQDQDKLILDGLNNLISDRQASKDDIKNALATKYLHDTQFVNLFMSIVQIGINKCDVSRNCFYIDENKSQKKGRALIQWLHDWYKKDKDDEKSKESLSSQFSNQNSELRRIVDRQTSKYSCFYTDKTTTFNTIQRVIKNTATFTNQ